MAEAKFQALLKAGQTHAEADAAADKVFHKEYKHQRNERLPPARADFTATWPPRASELRWPWWEDPHRQRAARAEEKQCAKDHREDE